MPAPVQDGYTSAGSYDMALANIRWSTDYLVKLLIGSPSDPANIKIVYQVCCTAAHCS